MADLFYEVRPDQIISRVIATIVASSYNHMGELVTKRTARMAQFLTTLKPRTVDRWWFTFTPVRRPAGHGSSVTGGAANRG
jgi:hypothetical protein